MSLGCSRWNRRCGDTVGFVGGVDRISHQGKLYLAASGLGEIIGDGELPNAGPEQIFDAFYRVGAFSNFGLDYTVISSAAQTTLQVRWDRGLIECS